MISVNVISRISDDKNSFFDLVYAIHKLDEEGVKDISVLFIGDIISNSLHQAIQKLISLFDLGDRIKFTRKSIRFNDLPDAVKAGYFLNFTVGNFIGYSGIESVNMGFKTLFYNGDKSLAEQTVSSASQCSDVRSLAKLLSNISSNQAEMDKLIAEDNLRMKGNFLLNAADKSFLMSVLLPSGK